MKFISKHSNISYVVVRQEIETKAGRNFVTRGIRVRFFGGQFDSVEAQLAFGWTDEEREMVEEYLKGTQDFRRGIIMLADQNWEPKVRPQGPAEGECHFTRRVGDESVACGKPVFEDGLYCEEHARLLSQATVAAKDPKPEKESAKAVVG